MRNTMEEWEKFAKKEKTPLNVRLLFTLTRPNLLVDESQSPGTRWRDNFIVVDHSDIEVWDDFHEANANQAFFKAINHETPFHPALKFLFENVDRPTPIEFENNLDSFFLNTIGPILAHAVGQTREVLLKGTGNEHALKLKVPCTKEPVKFTLPVHRGCPNPHLRRPNFPIYLPKKSMPRMTPNEDVIYVIGDTARLKSLDPSCFANKNDYRTCKAHVGKMAMYCVGAGTCLAFTMTSFGVTVFRFFIVDDTERIGVQQHTFPWCPDWVVLPKENHMSGIKAIYVLTIMSLFPEARRLREHRDLVSLEDWPRL